MIVYIDLEHARIKQAQPEKWQGWTAQRLRHKYLFEDMTGQPCLMIRYDRVTPQILQELRPQIQAVLVSGCYTDFEHYSEESLAGLRAVYRAAMLPTFGLCAGYQLMVQTYGAELGPMGLLPPGTPDPYDDKYLPGVKQERGFLPLEVITPHPLFTNLASEPVIFQDHYWEVKSLPDGFQVLAQSEITPLQSVAHTDLPLFGVQFHPEAFDDDHPDGRQIIENFFRINGVI